MSRLNSPHARTPAGLLIPMHATLRGEVRWQVLDEQGRPEIPRSPGGMALGPAEGVVQPNLITDLGLDRVAEFDLTYINFGNSSQKALNWRRYLAVGTGSTAPAVTDTTLDNEVERADTEGGFDSTTAYTLDGTDNVFRGEITAIRVVTMSADRNLTEFGLAHDATNDILIRELFRDDADNPITISLLSGKKLRLDHTLTLEMAAPTAGTSKTISIEEYAADGTLANTISQAVIYGPYATGGGATNIRYMFHGWVPSGYAGSQTPEAHRLTGTPTYDRAPGSNPSVGSSEVSGAFESYVAGSLQRIVRSTFGTAQENAAWGGFTFSFTSSENGGLMVDFDSPASYTKSDTDTLRVGVVLSWARA